MMEEQRQRVDVSDAKMWETLYGEDKAGWERHEVHPALTQWLADGTLKSPQHVVIPGCGRGREPLELAKRGFHVTAIDFSKTAVEFQTQQLKPFSTTAATGTTASVSAQDIFTFDPPEKFDVVYEQTCLCAIAPQRRGEYERSISRWLKPGGILTALFMQTEPKKVAPPFHCGIEEMKTLFDESRWEWIDETLVQHPHPRGKIFEVAAILKRKDTPNVG